MSLSYNEKEEVCKNMWLEYKDSLTKMCRYKLSNYPDEVEDVISDAFYYLCLAVFSDKPLNDPKAWLLAVTNNLIKKKYHEINMVKSKQVSLDEDNFLSRGTIETDFWDTLVSENIIERLSEIVINELSPDEQILYRYVYEERLKMKEIAALLKLTEVNVRQRNHRLSKKIKKLIKKYIEEV